MKRGRKLCRFGAGMWAVVLMCGALVASAAAQRAVRADGPKPEGAAWRTCGVHGVAVQVLGSGGPELQDKRASSSYLVWKDGRAVALVDAGGGSALRFGESGAQMGELEVILFSHFHVDHSGDFAALIKSSWFEERKAELPIYGPEGNEFMPSTTEFVSDFFGEKRGAYRYLSELLSADEKSDYKMQPHNVAGELKPVEAFRGSDLVASAVKVKHGGVPALAWRVDVGGKSISNTPNEVTAGKNHIDVLSPCGRGEELSQSNRQAWPLGFSLPRVTFSDVSSTGPVEITTSLT